MYLNEEKNTYEVFINLNYKYKSFVANICSTWWNR
jgi:hypothetical protein